MRRLSALASYQRWVQSVRRAKTLQALGSCSVNRQQLKTSAQPGHALSPLERMTFGNTASNPR
jgi:hypothetical protein